MKMYYSFVVRELKYILIMGNEEILAIKDIIEILVLAIGVILLIVEKKVKSSKFVKTIGSILVIVGLSLGIYEFTKGFVKGFISAYIN